MPSRITLAVFATLALAGCRSVAEPEPPTGTTPIHDAVPSPSIEPEPYPEPEPKTKPRVASREGPVTRCTETFYAPDGTAIGLGRIPARESSAHVVITNTAVEPEEFRRLVAVSDQHEDELLRCVLASHPDENTLGGELELAYTIGPAARVSAARVSVCSFPEPDICDCIRDEVALWRFPHSVQGVRVVTEIKARPTVIIPASCEW